MDLIDLIVVLTDFLFFMKEDVFFLYRDFLIPIWRRYFFVLGLHDIYTISFFNFHSENFDL